MLNDAGIDVDFEIKWMSWSNYDQTISNMISSGEEFDIFNRDIANINNYALNGGIYEITDEDLENYLPGVVEAMGQSLVDNCRYNGALYATPVAHEFAQWRGVYYNAAIAEEYDLDMESVKSIDDLDAIFEKLHEQAPDIYPLDTKNSENILMVMADEDDVNRTPNMCLGMDLADDAGGVYNIWQNEKVVKALHKIREWNEKGYLFTDTTADGNTMFLKEGKIFCHIARMKPGTVEQYSSSSITFKKVLFDETSTQTFCDFPGGWGNAISGTCSDPVAAMKVINFAYTNRDFIDLLVMGEKDVDYTADGDGVVSWGDTGYAADRYGDACWQMGNHYINSVTQSQKDTGLSDLGSQMKEFNDSAASPKHVGFYFDSSAYTAEVAAIANTYGEYYTSLILGEVDVDATLEEFNENLKANGIETLLDAANEQYQSFLSSK